MPSQKILTMIKGKPDSFDKENKVFYAPNKAFGAFWVSKDESVSSVAEIKDAIESFHKKKDYLLVPDVEYEVMHIGNMIANRSDKRVEDLDNRVRQAQTLALDYLKAFKDKSNSKEYLKTLRREAINKNLEIGYEVRDKLKESLREIRAFDDGLKVKIKGHSDLADMMRNISSEFPSQWNSSLKQRVHVELSTKSYFDANTNSISIRMGENGLYRFRSLEEAEQLDSKNPLAYSTYHEVVHEMSHKYESLSPNTVTIARNFLFRRAAKNEETGEYFMENETTMEDGSIKFLYYLDHFSDYYIGKYYPGDKGNEVFTVGVESALSGKSGSLIGLILPPNRDSNLFIQHRPDIEHRNLILGLLATMDLDSHYDAKPKGASFIGDFSTKLINGR